MEVFKIENELITKKDLLEKTGISYGQLYRWKRKKLIPESWFIRKATYTGQETFFPKEKIMNRIVQITELKDTLSLDELANRFSPLTMKNITLPTDEVLKHHFVSKASLNFYLKQGYEGKTLHFSQLLSLFLLDQLLKTGKMNVNEGTDLLQVLNEHGLKSFDKNSCLFFIRKMGVPAFFIVLEDTDVYFDKETHVVARLQLQPCAEKLIALVNSRGSLEAENREDKLNG
ncbi:DUF4004 family protein [Sporolactobacillus pectinivorans]|uniref:DUF4004 family protein n=1 Tax=Sporolactobacillus pectinivorans TaxID=1591408 RepID=UPI001EFEADEC|nr:DUF4004 family protein [Sporolactobacillus pectinivorans]